VGSGSEVRAMLVRLLDMLKSKQINSLFTALTHGSQNENLAQEAVSPLSDTWIKLGNEESGNDKVRNLYILKSRGMGHSGVVWNFLISSKGLRLTRKAVPPGEGSRKASGKTAAFMEEEKGKRPMKKKRG
jgi:circadian clock protein KaiC